MEFLFYILIGAERLLALRWAQRKLSEILELLEIYSSVAGLAWPLQASLAGYQSDIFIRFFHHCTFIAKLIKF